MENPGQAGLFEDNAPLPHGLLYLTDFITRAEEETLLAALGPLPFREARFQEYVAKRRVVHFGMDRSGAADPEGSTIGPLPPFLVSLRRKVAARLAING